MRIKGIKILLVVCLLTGISTAVAAKGGITKSDVYLFGLSASFKDSTVYITDIQKIDNADFAPKTKFMYNRDGYSRQLKTYVKELGVEHPTCITFYSTDKKKIDKRYAKVRQKYDANLASQKAKKKGQKSKKKSKPYFDVHYLTSGQFSYSRIALEDGTVYVEPKTAELQAKQSMKGEKKKKHKK